MDSARDREHHHVASEVNRALGSDRIVARFQRRRRVAFRIRNWSAAAGFVGLIGGVLLNRLLPRSASLWITPVALLIVIAVVGSFYAPHLYRCPRCGRRVQVADPTDSGYVLVKDPASCPNCGVMLR